MGVNATMGPRPCPILAVPGSPGNTSGAVIAELAAPWSTAHEAAFQQRRGHRHRPADACGVELRIDATQTQVRRPRSHRPGRRAFVSAKPKQNTINTTTCGDGHGRTLWSGAMRPGRMHDQTAGKTEGIADLLGQRPTVKVWVDESY